NAETDGREVVGPRGLADTGRTTHALGPNGSAVRVVDFDDTSQTDIVLVRLDGPIDQVLKFDIEPNQIARAKGGIRYAQGLAVSLPVTDENCPINHEGCRLLQFADQTTKLLQHHDLFFGTHAIEPEPAAANLGNQWQEGKQYFLVSSVI